MLTLVTNDDGIDSPGLHALASCARDVGLDVIVAAPSWNSSGASASLTATLEQDGRVMVEAREIEGVDAPAYSVEAAPAFIARAALHGAFGERPDLVLSGINDGPNTGHAILHSGTVGAAMTASTFGCPSAAFSLSSAAAVHWDTAVHVARPIIEALAFRGEPGMVINVNIPDIPLDDLRGIEVGRLAAVGAVQTNVAEKGADFVRLEYQPVAADYEEGTDAALLLAGYATITVLSPVCESPTNDVRDLLTAFARRN